VGVVVGFIVTVGIIEILGLDVGTTDIDGSVDGRKDGWNDIVG
jgi:hypothetical protein